MRFLFVRLSSMGDIVLTTPLIRALAERYPEAELHYLTRPAYRPLLQHHPLLTAVHTWPPSPSLQALSWKGIIDLQKNLRTLSLRWRLSYEKYATFPKENWRKWWMVRWGRPHPLRHIVLRYAEALQPWGISSEKIGPLEVHIPAATQEKIAADLAAFPRPWLAVGLGGTYGTKKWPLPYFQELLRELGWPVVLLGGAAEQAEAAAIAQALPQPTLNTAGRYSLLESAAVIAQAPLLLTHDTGTAHLGAAFRVPTLVLWGNTVPELGMTPWQTLTLAIEAQHLACRPCSKLGYARCPKGHHDCMRSLTPDLVLARLHSFWQKLRQGAP